VDSNEKSSSKLLEEKNEEGRTDCNTLFTIYNNSKTFTEEE
jgi:hypothetical protein